MGLATFKGGIHPYEGKELSENQPIEVLVPKGEMVYPLSQHIGAPATALVKKGDQVLVGQRIGEPGGFVSAPSDQCRIRYCKSSGETPCGQRNHGRLYRN